MTATSTRIVEFPHCFRARSICYVAGVSAVEFDTILLPEDIAKQVSLHCLACRQRLGSVAYADAGDPERAGIVAVSVALHTRALQDYRHGPEQVILVCGCGRRSTYHLL